ncbi:hypothetical protein BIU90_09050 [Curtobacterium sp. MCBA15_001]|nr:hypothetical protein BIU90_09050 [Curtobacterium sp. MCBA15_001]
MLLVRASAPLIAAPRALSHASAAAVLGLPFTAPPPDKVQVTDPRRSRPDASRFLQIHHDRAPAGSQRAPGRYDGLPATTPTVFAGTPVTSVVRTLVDVAACAEQSVAVPMIDAALRARTVLPDMLTEELGRVAPKAHARAQAAIAMGSAFSASPAESLARVRFRQLRTPEPIQQFEFSRPGQHRAVVDFWFPDHGVVVEVDGRAKYEDPEMLAGRSTADAHWREKQREDHIRSFTTVRGFVRLTWADLMDPEVVRVKLLAAGVPCG